MRFHHIITNYLKLAMEKYKYKWLVKIYCCWMNLYVIPFKEYPFARWMGRSAERSAEDMEDHYHLLKMVGT